MVLGDPVRKSFAPPQRVVSYMLRKATLELTPHTTGVGKAQQLMKNILEA